MTVGLANTPGLRKFLDEDRWVPLNLQVAAEVLRRAFALDEPTPARPDLHPRRVMALWRIVRAAMRACRRIADDETIEAATEGLAPDPWHGRLDPVATVPAPRGLGIVAACFHGDNDLPLICPPGPARAEAWCWMVGTAAAVLGMAEGRHPELEALLDPGTAPRACPTSEQVVALEGEVVAEVAGQIVEAGEAETRRHLEHEYGFTRAESLGVVRLARAELREQWTADPEEARAMLLAKMEKLYTEICATPDHRARLMLLREEAKIRGITRTDPEDQVRAFVNGVALLSQKRDEAEARRRAIEASAAPLMIAATNDDAEDLVEFDEEN